MDLNGNMQKKIKYKEIRQETKCKTCLGCNQLENVSFTEKYRCENYVRGAEDNGSRNNIKKWNNI